MERLYQHYPAILAIVEALDGSMVIPFLFANIRFLYKYTNSQRYQLCRIMRQKKNRLQTPLFKNCIVFSFCMAHGLLHVSDLFTANVLVNPDSLRVLKWLTPKEKEEFDFVLAIVPWRPREKIQLGIN